MGSFLYRLSHLLYLNGNIYEAECVYYLNKIMHSVDWFYQIELPEHFLAEHPLGSVLGKAKYSDYLFVYQGTTIGGNRNQGTIYYPQIGNNVILSADSYVINENIPDNCIVFGQSPNIIVKEKKVTEIKEMTKHIWLL